MNLFRSLFGSDENTVSAADAKMRIDQDKSLFILDVRQPEEFVSGHIAGAKLIPLGELGKRIHELPQDREILCVCASGARSSSAQHHLKGAGYKALNLRGGMMAWQGAGLPMQRGK